MLRFYYVTVNLGLNSSVFFSRVFVLQSEQVPGGAALLPLPMPVTVLERLLRPSFFRSACTIIVTRGSPRLLKRVYKS